jgi:ABC-type glycerol-3-phosphate transport system permease component
MAQGSRPLSRVLTKLLAHTALLLGSVLFLFPFFWMISASFKTPSELLGSAQSLLPSQITWENYDTAFFTTVPLLKNLYNSVFISGNYTVLALFFCSLGGFAFAKYDFPGRKWLFALMLGTMMVPGVVGLVPSFIIMKKLNWVNTYWSVVLPGTAHAFGIFFMRQYIRSIPDELIDAAKIDGCSDFGIYWRIILPVSSPALVTLAIMDFIGTWNDYMWPLIMLRTVDMYTIVLAITAFPSARFRDPWGAIMAGSTVSVLPLVILFLGFQKRLVSGITVGAIK